MMTTPRNGVIQKRLLNRLIKEQEAAAEIARASDCQRLALAAGKDVDRLIR